jgi:NDP-hexose 2,3-enoyl reductase
MDYTNLGRSGLKVSRLCLGTMNLGSHADEPTSHRILDRAVDAGINFVDTADVYGRKFGQGGTEGIIGRWLDGSPEQRDKIVLATKVYSKTGSSPNDRGLSARHIIAGCEASLRRLRTDWIDLYQMHHVDRSTPWEEIWQAMEFLVAQGKIRYAGSSNFAGWHLAAAQAAARERHLFGLVSEQCAYNLATRYVELEVIPAATSLGIAILPWSPLHSGLLAGMLRKRADGASGRSATTRAAQDLLPIETTIAAYEELCDRAGIAPATVALRWLLDRPGVTAPVVGPRTVEQLDSAITACSGHLDETLTADLEQLFPPIGKGGPAPEAWAW